MKASLTPDNKFIILRDMTAREIDQFRISFTKDIPNAYIIKKANPFINTKVTFFNEFGLIPSGLWLEVIETCQKYNFRLEFENDVTCRMQDCCVTYETFKEYIDNLFLNCKNDKGDKVAPMHYQLEGVFNLLKYRHCCVEVSTSGGKTLMSYILFKFLHDTCTSKKVLYIVPNIMLASQSVDKFELYDKWCGVESNWNAHELHSKITSKQKKEILDCTILFSTFQSLARKPAEFFNDFECVIVDECHRAQSQSIKNILERCHNIKWCFGLTGSFPKKGSVEAFNLQSYIGPIVYRLTAFDLINREKFATPIYIVSEILDYAPESDRKLMWHQRQEKDSEDPTAGGRLLKFEQNYANASQTRLKYICSQIIATKNNTLVLFGDIKGGYGKKLFNHIKEHSDKDVYYTDGQTSPDVRDYYKAKMEEDITGNTIIVASIGTFSEGVDIANLWTLFLVNSQKSERIVKQMCGRLMRNYPGKDKTVMFDIVDDFRYGKEKHDNYLWKHHLERIKIYKEQRHPTFERKINLSESKLF